MNTKRIIKRILFITITLAVCSGLLVLLVAAIGRKNKEHCKDYVIKIKAAKNNVFIGEKDVLKLIATATDGKIRGKLIADFNLKKLEQQLKDNAWIQAANLYFDNRNVLHISVVEKEPIARIFTTGGRSFYIDSGARKMPLSDKVSARVPVFTNFPDKRFLSEKDSALLNDVRKTAWFILNDPFWMSQTEQIDITEHKTFEMIPTIGRHIVKLGNGDDIARKFHRLFVFYQQVLSETSFDKYNFIDVQYAGQVIGTKEKINRVDSVQLKKNIEKLLKEARDMQKDTTISIPMASGENVADEDKKPKAVMPARN
jgi:cell division protein FtsQ